MVSGFCKGGGISYIIKEPVYRIFGSLAILASFPTSPAIPRYRYARLS